LYNIITGFGVPMNLYGLIKSHLKETNSKFRRSKHWSDTFPMRTALKN